MKALWCSRGKSQRSCGIFHQGHSHLLWLLRFLSLSVVRSLSCTYFFYVFHRLRCYATFKPRHPTMPSVSPTSHIAVSLLCSPFLDPRLGHCWREYVSVVTDQAHRCLDAGFSCALQKVLRGENPFAYANRDAACTSIKPGDSFIIMGSCLGRSQLIYSVYTLGSVKGKLFVCGVLASCCCCCDTFAFQFYTWLLANGHLPDGLEHTWAQTSMVS